MALDEDTRDRLAALAAGTLPEAEAAKLREQMAGDAALAEAFREVGAKSEPAASPLPPRKTEAPPAAPPSPKVRKSGESPNRSFAWAAHWVVGLAALSLLAVSVGGYWYHRDQLATIIGEHVRLRVVGPAVLESGTEAAYAVATTTVTGQGVPTEVRLAFDPTGEDGGFVYTDTTDEHGRLEVVIPADMIQPGEAELKVEVRDGSESRSPGYVSRVRVDPARYVTHVSLDRPHYRPGDPLHFRTVTLSRLALAAEDGLPVRVEILGPDGKALAGVAHNAKTQRGTVGGTLPLPAALPAGRYALAARSPSDVFPPRRRGFVVLGDDPAAGQQQGDQPQRAESVKQSDEPEQAGEPSEEPSVETPPVDVRFYPESGPLVPELENRIYFVARDVHGEPVAIEGRVVDSDGMPVAMVQTQVSGMGSFSFVPHADEPCRLKITAPEGIADEPEIPEAEDEARVLLNTGNGVFDPAGPLEFVVRSVEPGLPLVIAASCRGVPVGQQMLVTADNEDGLNTLVMPLDENVGGAVHLEVFDYSESPPVRIAQRLVYRKPGRKLRVEAVGLAQHYAPGETVKLGLKVTDENGEPVPAVLGAVVVDAAARNPGKSPPASLPANILLGQALDKAKPVPDLEVYLSEAPESALALDLLLGTHDCRTPESGDATTPPLVYDNLPEIQANYEHILAEYRADRTKLLNTLTTASFFGGLGLMLLVAMLGLMKIVSGVHLWVPAIGVTVCCLVIGAILMDPARLKASGQPAAAFQSYNATVAEEANESPTADDAVDLVEQSGDEPADRQPADMAAAASSPASAETGAGLAPPLYWQPMLLAGADGTIDHKIEFTVPSTPSTATYILYITAHADGRLGSARAELVVNTHQKGQQP